MIEIKVRKDVVIALTHLSGKIQTIKNRKMSASATIGLLLKFMKNNQRMFWNGVKRQSTFEEGYEGKIKIMQQNGIPTTRDFRQGKRCETFETNNGAKGRSEMRLRDNSVMGTPLQDWVYILGD